MFEDYFSHFSQVLFIIDGANDVEAFMDDVTANNNFEVS